MFESFRRPRKSPSDSRSKIERRLRPSFDALESRLVPTADFRSFDGTGNNLQNPTLGSAGSDLIRIAPAAYADGLSAPNGADRPSARAVSNAVAAQGDVDLINARGLSAMAYEWGQFIDHDIDLTNDGTQAFNIKVPTGDTSFDPFSTGTQTLPFNRSQFDPATG